MSNTYPHMSEDELIIARAEAVGLTGESLKRHLDLLRRAAAFSGASKLDVSMCLASAYDTGVVSSSVAKSAIRQGFVTEEALVYRFGVATSDDLRVLLWYGYADAARLIDAIEATISTDTNGAAAA